MRTIDEKPRITYKVTKWCGDRPIKQWVCASKYRSAYGAADTPVRAYFNWTVFAQIHPDHYRIQASSHLGRWNNLEGGASY